MRFNAIYNRISQNDICPYCSSSQPNIVYKQPEGTISMEYKGKKGENKISIMMTVDDIKKIFNNIPEEDIILLGLDPNRMHPRNFIISNLLVIPPCSRPYVKANNNICDDDLTKQYREIVNLNNRLKDLPTETDATTEQKRQKIIQSQKFYISTMMNNSKGKSRHPTDNRPFMCFKNRLAGKGGRLRGNLMGKRVDFSARTVIGADPTLKLGQLGIPREVARIHTKPEIVTEYNIEWLTTLVNNGEANFVTTVTVRDGKEVKTRLNLQYATFQKGTDLLYDDIIIRDKSTFIKPDKKGTMSVSPELFISGKAIRVVSGDEKLQSGDRLIRNGYFVKELKYPTKINIKLKLGDIVERHLQDNDICLFNRQPRKI